MEPPAPLKRSALPLLLLIPVIALALSGIITAINVGVRADFFVRWLWSFAAALPVLPVALLLSGLVERILVAPLYSLPVAARRTVVSLITACLIELALATVVTWSNLGLSAVFGDHWVKAFLQSLPIGVLIALTMNFIVKPRFLEAAN